jgi:hypothetical protein
MFQAQVSPDAEGPFLEIFRQIFAERAGIPGVEITDAPCPSRYDRTRRWRTRATDAARDVRERETGKDWYSSVPMATWLSPAAQ